MASTILHGLKNSLPGYPTDDRADKIPT